MKDKAAIVIAALMITSMAFGITATNVSAALATATLKTPSVKASTRELITIEVTNSGADNIENVLIRVVGGGFENAIGGATAKSALDNAADNLSAAAAQLSKVGDNLKEAAADKIAAGAALESAADALDSAGGFLKASGHENAFTAGYYLCIADENLRQAADLLQEEPENLVLIGIYLADAADKISLAGSYLEKGSELELIGAGDNLMHAADRLENYVDNYLIGGVLWIAGDNLDNAALYIETAGQTMSGYSGSGDVAIKLAANVLDNQVAKYMKTAAARLKRAAENIRQAGEELNDIFDLYLDNVRSQTSAADDNLSVAAGLLKTAFDNIDNAAMDMKKENNENILSAGLKLGYAADNLSDAATALGKVLGEDELDSAATKLEAAANNLENAESVNLTAAGDNISAVATGLSTAAAKIKETAGKLKPDTATLTEGLPTENDVNFGGENIEPTKKKEFTFIWSTPTITTDADYTIRVWVWRAGSVTWELVTDLTIHVDAEFPSLSIVVTQEGVALNNLVGDEYQNGYAMITITATEPLSAIGDVYIYDNDHGENLSGKISLVTTDNIVFTGVFEVGEWDENKTVVYVKAPCATDLFGLPNPDNFTSSFLVDTRAPVLLDNGLQHLLDNMDGGQKVQAGTGYLYWVDNQRAQTINGNVEDNWALGTRLDNAYDNVLTILNVTVKWDTLENSWAPAYTPTPDNRFSVKITLNEGLTSMVKVRATDWTGNYTEDNVENIFVDINAPTIAFNTITKTSGAVSWADGIRINDSTPEIKLTIKDPGYPTTGLGIALDNLIVQLDDDDNIWNDTPYWTLDNKGAWDFGLEGVFENIIDNALPENTYYVNVWASDNLLHGAENGTVASRSFVIDTTAPTWTTDALENAVTFYWRETMSTIPTTTKKTTWYIVGSARESGSTINVYAPDNATLVGSTTASTTAPYNFAFSVTMSEGINVVYIEEVDNASNSSGKVIYGTYTVDKTPPVITLTGPADGTTTDAAQITVSGTVVDAIVPYDQLVVTIDCTGAAVSKPVYLNEDGSFSATVPLVEGVNVINVKAADAAEITALAGNQTVTTRTVVRTAAPSVPAPSPDVNPLHGTTLGSPLVQTTTSLTVSGTGMTGQAGYTIKVYIKNAATGATAATETTTVGSDGSWSKTITLPAAGTKYKIEVTCTNAAGTESSAVLYGYVLVDVTAPTVEIFSPTTGSTTYEETVVVSGTVSKDEWEAYNSGAMPVTATIQVGSATPSTVTIAPNGVFSVSVALVTGTNTVTVRAVDSAGNSDLDMITVIRAAVPVIRDISPPTVTLDALPPTIDAASITVTGKVTKDLEESYSEITVYVQSLLTSRSIPAGAGGNFSVPVALVEGPNMITVYAVDASGNVSDTKTATVERVTPVVIPDTTPPTVTVTAPTTGAETGEVSIVVKGKSTEPGTWTVAASSGTLTGATDSAGNFTVPVPLVEGKNTIVVTATDAAGNVSASVSIEVTRTVTPWATYAIIIVIIVLILAAIAIFRKK